MNIFITTQFEGFHKWDKAPKEVSFLRNKHRHLFKVKIWLKVEHNDRDLEFFTIKKNLIDFINKNINKEDAGSCEMMCEIISKFHPAITQVSVSEDDENGAMFMNNKLNN